MVRMFSQHEIRKQQELSGYWRFNTLNTECSVNTAYVPGCWESIPGLENYRGRAAYETDFSGGGNLRLKFGGVSHSAAVWLDGKPLGTHYNAYTPFSFLARGAAQGRHTLLVEADNRFSDASALHIPNDYRTYGGVIRPVTVEEVADVWIERVLCKPVMQNGNWQLHITAALHNVSDTDKTVTLTCQTADYPAASWNETLPARSDREARLTYDLPDAQPYEPDNLHLYLLRFQLRLGEHVVDDLLERIGLREITVKDGRILWNGQPFYIKGFNRHEAYADFGCTGTAANMSRDLALLSDVGANAIRTSHYPNDERFLDLCDECGVFIWEEAHARGLSEERMVNPHFTQQSEACIREMILSHYNHPCIGIWGLLNECADNTPAGCAEYERQFALVRTLDSSRPVTAASCHPSPVWFDPKDLKIPNCCLELADIMSFNTYPGWYFDDPINEYIQKLCAGIRQSAGPEPPILISEIGAGAIYNFHSHTWDKWSEEQQAEILDRQLAALRGNQEIAGFFIWQFCDVRVDEEWFAQRPKCLNNKGIVNEYRRPKLAYQTVKTHLRNWIAESRLRYDQTSNI